uniref:Small ribosomal subunit protein uS3c n=1 Tax=Chaetophora sp. FACHB-2423 TaxID=2725789 RepID=A0A6H1XE15_9CHLO|nr:ribosomal protein S3 [Chaetophora sp. FACHB-2423]
MGQKIHPYGYRVGITQPHSARWFANTYQYPQYVFEDFLLRQSLFKNLPVENLPRKRTEDKSETKLVQIKIERLIRNTIKIKLYVTSPETASELFEHEENSQFTKSSKNDFGATKSNKRNLQTNFDSKKDRNTLRLDIQKRLLNKKLLQLQILKLQNMQSKLLTIKNVLDGSFNTNTSVFSSSSNNIAINYSIGKTLIEGIKDCLTMNFEEKKSDSDFSFNKVKYLFYYLQLKKQLSKTLLYQLDIYQKIEKQKLINFTGLNKSEEQISAFQSKINFRLFKLKTLSLKWKNHSKHLTNVLVNIQSKLSFELAMSVKDGTYGTGLEVKLDQNKTNLTQKCLILINILKLKYIFRKNNFNKLELFVLNQKIEEINLKWNVTETRKPEGEILLELNRISCEKQKLLTLLTKFKFSLNFYNIHLEKTKKIILAGLFLSAKLSCKKGPKKKEIFNGLNTFLSKSVLMIKKLEIQLGRNYTILQERLLVKINHITILESTIKQNLHLLQILQLAQDYNTNKTKIKVSQLYKNLFNVFSMTSLFATKFKYQTLKHKTFLYDFVSQSFDKYALLISQKVLNLNSNKFLTLLKKEYLSHLISLFNYDSITYHKAKALYQYSLALLNQRYKLNKMIEMKIRNLLLTSKSEEKTKNSSLVVIRDLNISLKSNILFIKKLETWLTLLKKKLTENSSTNRYLLQVRIHKIDCYLKKMIPLKMTENNLVSTIEKNFIFVNYNILKQKLLSELVQMQKTIILSKKEEATTSFSSLFSPLKTNISISNLNKTLQILQNQLSDLQSKFKQENQQKIANIGQIFSGNAASGKLEKTPSFFLENKTNISTTLQLKTTLQNLLKTNYENSFVVLQTRRQVYNSVRNRLGGYRKLGLEKSRELEMQDGISQIWKNPYEIAESLDFKVNNSIEPSTLPILLETIKQKIYERKPIKLMYTRKQKFLAKKTIKKKLNYFLVLMAIKNNYKNVSALKKIYDVKTFTKLCENLTNLQTMPKVSVIELVKVHQPKQYAVCLANFVVENLEKRFSFRSTMKRASEQAMSTTNVKGIKIQISGRLNGAEIARTEWLRDGVVPLQTLRANIDYSYKTAKTIYGILGVKVWLFKDTPANMNS